MVQIEWYLVNSKYYYYCDQKFDVFMFGMNLMYVLVFGDVV